MLLSKSIRITPILVDAITTRIAAPSVSITGVEQPAFRNFAIKAQIKERGVKDYTLHINKNFNDFTKSSIAPLALTSVRFYADDTKRSPQKSTISAPAAPNLPSREQVERFLFRVLALIWDISVWAYANAKYLIQKHVVDNENVQYYWKRTHERMEKAKKEW